MFHARTCAAAVEPRRRRFPADRSTNVVPSHTVRSVHAHMFMRMYVLYNVLPLEPSVAYDHGAQLENTEIHTDNSNVPTAKSPKINNSRLPHVSNRTLHAGLRVPERTETAKTLYSKFGNRLRKPQRPRHPIRSKRRLIFAPERHHRMALPRAFTLLSPTQTNNLGL